jgi:hypothetical protein
MVLNATSTARYPQVSPGYSWIAMLCLEMVIAMEAEEVLTKISHNLDSI